MPSPWSCRVGREGADPLFWWALLRPTPANPLLSSWLQPESPSPNAAKDAAPTSPKPDPPKSPDPPSGSTKSLEPVLNGATNGPEGPRAGGDAQGDDGQGLSRRRVVRVVRKVVRKVLPGDDAGEVKPPEPMPPPRKEETVPPAPPPPPPPAKPSAPAKPEPKDEISAGLTTLMAKGKTKEHRARVRPGDRREEKSPEPAAGDAKPAASPGAKATPEPPARPSGGKAEPAKASAPKPTALERHKVARVHTAWVP